MRVNHHSHHSSLNKLTSLIWQFLPRHPNTCCKVMSVFWTFGAPNDMPEKNTSKPPIFLNIHPYLGRWVGEKPPSSFSFNDRFFPRYPFCGHSTVNRIPTGPSEDLLNLFQGTAGLPSWHRLAYPWNKHKPTGATTISTTTSSSTTTTTILDSTSNNNHLRTFFAFVLFHVQSLNSWKILLFGLFHAQCEQLTDP